MDKVIWLLAGNKGGCGKSVMAKSLVDWLCRQHQRVVVVDGDLRTPDVAAVYAEDARGGDDGGGAAARRVLPCRYHDLREAAGWTAYADALCAAGADGLAAGTQVVTNLPHAIDEPAMAFLEHFTATVQARGLRVRLLFVMNTLADGLGFLERLARVFPDLTPVKNLAFGKVRQFEHFDAAYGLAFDERVLLLPAMPARIMQVVRDSNYSFADFLAQRGNQHSNTLHAKLVVADWRDNMLEALDDVLFLDPP